MISRPAEFLEQRHRLPATLRPSLPRVSQEFVVGQSVGPTTGIAVEQLPGASRGGVGRQLAPAFGGTLGETLKSGRVR
jgi:hypothetical protein